MTTSPEPAGVPKKRSTWTMLGPTLIVAAVVIGPGTITVASRLGASQGYRMLWVIIGAAIFMWLFATMAARVAILNRDSLMTTIARLYGRPLAILVGALAFTATTAFQLSNYLACATALQTMAPLSEPVWIGVVGAGGLAFLIVRHLYTFAERIMRVLVFAMVAAFIINMVASRPDILAVAAGFIPRSWPPEINALLIAMLATTFSVIAALYQGPLARQKGWTAADIGTSRREAAVGIGMLATISCVVMITAGTVLRGAEVTSAAVLAGQFQPVLGSVAVWLFSLGFLAAGFSSVVLNPMVGGGLLSDGLGLGERLDEKWPRILTAAGMLAGMIFAWLTLRTGSALDGIVFAQNTTILAVPLCAIVLTLAANDKRAVGVHRNSVVENIIACAAILVLVAISIYKLMPK